MIANTLQASDYTSIQERITELSTSDKNTKPNDDKSAATSSEPLKPLAQFDGAAHLATQSGIPFNFCDYLQLIDWTGRAIRPDKKVLLIQASLNYSMNLVLHPMPG